MARQKTFLVIGATGAQGGSVAAHLLQKGNVNVRAMTRNPGSSGALRLREAGAEVVRGDLDRPESIQEALEGCWGVFGVTNYMEHFEREYLQGRILVDAVAASGVEFFAFSTLPSAKKISGGELEVPHLDLKARLEEYSRELGLPAVYLHLAFYYENFLSFHLPRREADGSFVFGFPQGDTPLAAVAVEDLGGVVAAILERPAGYFNKTVGVVGDDAPPSYYAEVMSRLLGRKVVYRHVPREDFAALGFPGAAALANMFDLFRRFVPNQRRDLELCRALYPEIRSFEAWLAANREQFVLGAGTA